MAGNSFQNIGDNLHQFLANTAFSNLTPGHIIMILIGLAFIFFAITKEMNPLLLIPIGFGIIIGNIPFSTGFLLGIGEDGSVLNYLYLGVIKGIYPSLIFLGIGAMTDFSSLIANPKLILIGIGTQLGIFSAFAIAMALGFTRSHAGAISIIGGGDGITAIFLSAKLAPELIGIIAISAFTYVALIPFIQPPVMKLLTTIDQDEANAGCVEDGKSGFPTDRYFVNLFHCTGSIAFTRDVILWQLIQGEWCD